MSYPVMQVQIVILYLNSIKIYIILKYTISAHKSHSQGRKTSVKIKYLCYLLSKVKDF